MSRILRYGIFSIALSLSFSFISVCETSAQNVLGDILRRMDGNNKTLQSLQANVTMAKHNPQLNVTDVLVGSTSYLPKSGSRQMYVRIDWKTENGRPMEESMAVIGDQYKLYRKRVNQVITGKTGNAKNGAAAGGALAFMSMNKEQLRQNYTVQLVAEEKIKGGIQTAHLLLTPKVAGSYKSAELWVDTHGMPLQAKVTEQNGDTTTVLLENIRKNVTIKATEFELIYDKKKVRIIEA
ncbi:MAG TPA: outer membrane lipoprotein carrier protein LolA [Pyrinomonadaceae bacterium]|nr:outer membrane lipoprotein carrier protein LolA [Pyrinomonadaceae bacterium]